MYNTWHPYEIEKYTLELVKQFSSVKSIVLANRIILKLYHNVKGEIENKNWDKIGMLLKNKGWR